MDFVHQHYVSPKPSGTRPALIGGLLININQPRDYFCGVPLNNIPTKGDPRETQHKLAQTSGH